MPDLFRHALDFLSPTTTRNGFRPCLGGNVGLAGNELSAPARSQGPQCANSGLNATSARSPDASAPKYLPLPNIHFFSVATRKSPHSQHRERNGLNPMQSDADIDAVRAQTASRIDLYGKLNLKLQRKPRIFRAGEVIMHASRRPGWPCFSACRRGRRECFRWRAHRTRPSPDRGEAEMRGKDRVRQIAERIVGRKWLGVVDIERGEYAPVTQGGDQRGLIDDRSARGVDEDHALFHAREIARADQPARTGPEDKMHRDGVRLGKEPVLVDAFGARFFGLSSVRFWLQAITRMPSAPP